MDIVGRIEVMERDRSLDEAITYVLGGCARSYAPMIQVIALDDPRWGRMRARLAAKGDPAFLLHLPSGSVVIARQAVCR